MQAARRHRRTLAALALFAALALALLPTVSRALGSVGTQNPFAELCSTAQPEGSKAPVAAGHGEHCPLCSPAAGGGVLPPPMAMFQPARREGSGHVPALLALAPRPLFAHAGSPPRAPPAEA